MTECDVLVMGAGPAGSVAATLLARRGVSVMLVEKKSFPRSKVCGACLSGFAINSLKRVGLDSVLRDAVPLSSFQLIAQKRVAAVPLEQGCAISRSVLDAALKDLAVNEGVAFFEETNAVLGPIDENSRLVALTSQGRSRQVRAKAVVIATGLSGATFRLDPQLQANVSASALIGAGSELPEALECVPEHQIVMATHQKGYVGFVRTEQNTTNIAAALDRQFITRQGGVDVAAQCVVDSAGLGHLKLDDLCWKGTPPLTRRANSLASHRTFVIGDAAGYVEPFTGEGIGWAIASGIEVVPFVSEAVGRWNELIPTAWTATYAKSIGRRQRVCRAISVGLKSPILVQTAIRVLRPFPQAARPLIQHLAAP